MTLMVPGGADLRLTVGSTTLDLMLQRDRQDVASWTRKPAAALRGIQSPYEVFPGFGRGCGSFAHVPGFYALALAADNRFGYVMPGPREEADITGVAQNFRTVDHTIHNGVDWIATTDGTDTKVYRRLAGSPDTWVLKRTSTTAVAGPHCLVSLDGVIACFLGSVAYVFSSDDGANWSSSGKTGDGPSHPWSEL